MKTRVIAFCFSITLLTCLGARAATVINADTNISPINTSFDGADLIVSNCTVTIDGVHGFNSLLVTSNGVVTHTALPNGSATVYVSVTNEPQILTGTNPVTLIYSNISSITAISDTSGLILYTNGVDYVQTNLADSTTQIYRTDTSSIPDGATVLVSYVWTYSYSSGLTLSATNDVRVDNGSSINANGLGFGPGIGSGHGFSTTGGGYLEGGGAGHGGNGALSQSGASGGSGYGSVNQPVTLGSGGGAGYAGSGGKGGGRIQIIAGGTVAIDGVITANGTMATNSRAGGGSGGSIWIVATNFSGAGSLFANGGAGDPGRGGGGGGGRISIQCGTNLFTGSLTACGAAGAVFYGGAGTIYLETNGQPGLLTLDNNSHTGSLSAVSLATPADVLVRNGAWLAPQTLSPRNLTVATNALLVPNGATATTLNVSGDFVIQTGGTVNFDSAGYAPGTGNGPGTAGLINGYYCGGGAGHGGYGTPGNAPNANGGLAYDSQTAPTMLGSGGGANPSYYGGNGGGALQLTVAGKLQVDGRITANGGNGFGPGTGGGGGGGSGGSIYITSCSWLTGNGSITANGGNGTPLFGGGGGGGRIAIYADTNTFNGVITAAGGSGLGNYGGAGTLFTQFGGSQQLQVDNAGNRGTNTPLQSASSARLIVQNGASATASSAVTFDSLLTAANGWLSHAPASSLNLIINHDAIIQPNSGFVGDLLGRSSGQGFSPGSYNAVSPYYPGGGGAYGGKGGAGTNNVAGGSNSGDIPSVPSATYSGSGGGGVSSSSGGYGGGFFQISVGGTLQHDGVISANGGNGFGTGGGGGAGGGVYLSVNQLQGAGSISVNGGNGANNIGGGGGGGRIAIYFNSNNFTGTLAANGGAGFTCGGGGTIYLKTNSANYGQVIVDNAGQNGADTILSSAQTAEWIFRNGGSGFLSGGTFATVNLTIGTNGLFLAGTNGSSTTITANNLTVQAGGSMIADAGGYAPGTGTSGGAGGYYSVSPNYPGGGGGHGGYGGNSTSNSYALGGNYNDNATSPSYAGSGGGGSIGFPSVGGRGGGIINLTLSGNFQVDGNLSANGGNGSGAGGGGGAGGTLKINCNKLLGAGNISANGGSGANSIGGGGGGGMIYANCTSNLFTGVLSAYGGGGANFGGAGTIYLVVNSVGSHPTLTADNGGHRGAPTPLVSAYNWVIRNGAVAWPVSQNFSIYNLLISSNAWLIPATNASGQLTLNINSSAVIQAGGGISADGFGYGQNQGTGHGGYTFASSYLYPCSGGGYGGWGAFPALGSSFSALGLNSYGSTAMPTMTGSGGGGYSPYSVGGNGGGYIRLVVNGTLENDGSISVNGGSGSGLGGGGGSGGSVYITSPGSVGPGLLLTGSGSITANGGNGASYGGGGGGGRIALYFDQYSYTGKVYAVGGGGYAYGGAGTVYLKTNFQPYATLILDNANNPGTNTSFDFLNLDVIVQNLAMGLLPPSGTWSAHNIVIHTNAALVGPGTSSTPTLIANNLTIDAGGRLSLDANGSSAQTGSGYGYYSSNLRGGGGYGGYGGGNLSGFGKAYGSIITPTSPGSGGASYGSGPPYGYGGAGGGSLQLNVNGTLACNGSLSANGGNGNFNCGGGSGGSLNLYNIGNLTGSGVISANGGATGGGAAGGGGGGRIALNCNSNNFAGQITAYGGNGAYPGGAGTIYTFINGLKTVTVDNGPVSGTNTPLDSAAFALPSSPFDLNVLGAAKVVPVSPLPLLSNLNVSANAAIVTAMARTQLVIAALHDINLSGSITLDSLGYAQTNGPGAGAGINNQGAGGGYGGAGGASASGALGGITYGSASQPTDFGSGGGNGYPNLSGGSEGGGAVRISAGGTLNINGTVSANGDFGWQDNSGGGAGGSVWLSAATLTGSGTIAAAGGNGDLWNGGGGGGGRIAIYAPTNLFTGVTNASGGLGSFNGQDGTIFLSSAWLNFQIQAQTPSGLVSNTVSSVDLTFNEALDPASVTATAFTLTTPSGIITAPTLTAALTGPATLRVSFPVQHLLGDYSLQTLPALTNIFGQGLTQSYTNFFTITLPTISGTVSDTNGAPVAGVAVATLFPPSLLVSAFTDTNGFYSLGVPPGWSGTLTPYHTPFVFVPGTLTFTNVTSSLTNQNFLMYSTIAPNVASSLSGTNLNLNWFGIAGVNYQAWSSTNLADWVPYGSVIPGTNGVISLPLPVDGSPSVFYRLTATN